MSSPTVGPSLSPVSGRLSSSSSMSPSASPQVITPRLTARLSGRFRRLGDISGPTVMTTSTAGTASSRGPSMHKIPSSKPPPASPLSSAYSATNPLCFPGQKSPPTFQLSTTCSERVWDSAHVQLQHAVRRHKTYADACRSSTPVYHHGDKVWLSTRGLRLCLPCRKLSPRYIGPFTIERQITEVTFHLQLPARYRIHPAFHVSLLKPVSPSVTDPDEPAVPPPPEIIEEPLVYRVQDILDSRRRGGRLEYLIDWEGYGPEERSWVARDDVLDPSLLAEFHQNYPDCPAPRGHGWPRRRNRASGVAPGGGGTVRESPQSPQSPPTTLTRSQSPDYCSPPPVSINQQHYIPALLPFTHCLVSNIPCWLPWPTYPFVYLPVAPVFRSPFSTAPVLHRLHAPLFPLDPLE